MIIETYWNLEVSVLEVPINGFDFNRNILSLRLSTLCQNSLQIKALIKLYGYSVKSFV